MKIVLAYSGGLDTSAIIPWLKDNYEGAQIYALAADVGQGAAELANVEQKALASGAAGCKIADLKEELVSEFITPMATLGALYEGKYLLGTAIARPAIARALVDYARQIGAAAIAHGATGKGNDQVRFEYTIAALAPELRVIAPWRVWEHKSRGDLLDYLASKGIATTASREKIYSQDANLWHVSTEGGALEDPANAPNEHCYAADVIAAPNEPEEVQITIEQGAIMAINGEQISSAAAIERLNEMGLRHAIGQLDLVENRLVGLKSRGCYETPGGTIYYAALRALEELVYDRDALRLRQQLGAALGELIYDGKWFTPARAAICAAGAELAGVLSGCVRMRLYKGSCTPLAKSSPNSLYAEEFATFEEDAVYDQRDAAGFIQLFSLSARIRALKGLNDKLN